jgi:hypothetical protein
MTIKKRALSAAQSALQAGAEALQATLDEIPVVRVDMPPLEVDGSSWSFIYLWPGELVELAEGGKWVQTPVSELLRLRWHSGMHLLRHTRGKPLLSRQVTLTSGRTVTAAFMATGRVLVFDEQTGRTLARSVPCKPFELDPQFIPPVCEVGEVLS